MAETGRSCGVHCRNWLEFMNVIKLWNDTNRRMPTSGGASSRKQQAAGRKTPMTYSWTSMFQSNRASWRLCSCDHVLESNGTIRNPYMQNRTTCISLEILWWQIEHLQRLSENIHLLNIPGHVSQATPSTAQARWWGGKPVDKLPPWLPR